MSGEMNMQRIREIKKYQSGFTLIELLIVIVILGILAAVVVFAVSAFNNNGKAAACQSDFKNVEIADEAYYARNTAKTNPPLYATAYAAQLVPTYLKEAPSTTNGYTINLTTAGVTVTVPGATVTDIGACSSLS
jgi:prepilin-type N-terminal cleavage/methylation domain-containing protein